MIILDERADLGVDASSIKAHDEELAHLPVTNVPHGGGVSQSAVGQSLCDGLICTILCGQEQNRKKRRGKQGIPGIRRRKKEKHKSHRRETVTG